MNWRHDELMTGMRATTDQRLDQVDLQMQDMITMIGRLVNSVFPSPRPEVLPGQDPTQNPTDLKSNGNPQGSASHELGRLVFF